jgi:hypothetical protein
VLFRSPVPAERVNRVSFGDESEKPIAATKRNPFIKAFSDMRPEVKKDAVSPVKPTAAKPVKRVAKSGKPGKNLKAELYKTYIEENKYLSALGYSGDEDEDEEYEEESEEDEPEPDTPAPKKAAAKPAARSGKSAKTRELSPGPLKVGNRDVLQMKLDFEEASSAIPAESVNIIRSFAQIAIDQPTNSIEIGISQEEVGDAKKKSLAARRLAIVSNILRNAGLSDRQIAPVLTDRAPNSFSFRVVHNDRFKQLNVSEGVDAFGDAMDTKSYRLMQW